MTTTRGPALDTGGQRESPPGPRQLSWRSLTLWLPLAAWVLVIAGAVVVGYAMQRQVKLQALPLIGDVDPVLSLAMPVALLGGLALAAVLPGWCERLGWRRMLAVVALVSIGWGVALALVRGHDDIDRGLDGAFEYVAAVPTIQAEGIGPVAETFTDPEVLRTYPIHVQGHPLGATLLFVGLDEVGLGGSYRAFLVMLVVGAATGPAVLVAARAVAGESLARRAAPFLAVGPAAIWTVSSADALFAAVGAAAVATVVVAACRARPDGVPPAGGPAWSPARVAAVAVAGGALFGLGVQLSYGLAVLVAVPGVVALWYRQWRVLAWAAVGGLAVLAVVGVAGYWWFDGLDATRERYFAGVASDRPYWFFSLLGNPAAFAVAAGPAAVIGLARLRDARLGLLVGGGWLAVLIANFSGMSKGEIERIWLPFVPWVLLAAAAVAPSTHHRRPPTAMPWRIPTASHLLALPVVVAVAVESVVYTPW
ncbi:hypothetical protein BH20ACT3_BH20ACT3_06990 [soil metagenome]